LLFIAGGLLLKSKLCLLETVFRELRLFSDALFLRYLCSLDHLRFRLLLLRSSQGLFLLMVLEPFKALICCHLLGG